MTTGQKKNKKKKNRTARSGRWTVNPYVDMVLNPCESTLVPGLYGTSEGLLARLKATYHIPALGGTPHGASTCGYVLWCPDFCNKDDGFGSWTTQGNLFEWQHTSSSVAPSNSGGFPYGTCRDRVVDGTVTTLTLDDPAANLVRSDIVSDARVLGACMQMTYYGKMLDAAGEVGYISNLPVNELLSGGAGGIPISVDDLLVYCNNKQRMGVDTLEAVYRPNELSSNHFRTNEQRLLGMDTPNPTIIPPEAATLSPRCFGFVWRNVEPDAGLVFDFTKSIEWRAEAGSGLSQTPIHTTGSSLVPSVNAIVDSHERRVGKSLWERLKASTSTLRSEISKIALTGTGSKLLKDGAQYLASAGMRMGLKNMMAEAPLMLI